jgi:hypothetical protein
MYRHRVLGGADQGDHVRSLLGEARIQTMPPAVSG